MQKDKKKNKTLLDQINWPRFMVIIWLLWTINSLFSTFQAGLYRAGKGEDVLWMHIFWYTYTSALIWVGFIPVITWIVFRTPIGPNKWTKAILTHLFFAAIISFPQRFLHLTLDYVVQNTLDLWGREMTYTEYLSSLNIGRTIGGMVTYFVIAALLYGYYFYLKNREHVSIEATLRDNLNKSRIQNLKHQIKPHFLFNSMQVISNLMYKNVKLADEAITQLSDLLRLSIRQLEVDEILLSEEMDVVREYLHFQKLRFGDNVTFDIDYDVELNACKVPAMLLQPFVENSIQYGFEKTGQPTHAQIDVNKNADRLEFRIKDNGPGFDVSKVKEHTGIGIKNVLTRLESLYGSDFTFRAESEDEGTEICIHIPYKR